MQRYRVEVQDKEGKKIEIIENFATIEGINNFDERAVVERPIIPLYGSDTKKISADDIYFSNFKRKDRSTLIIVI